MKASEEMLERVEADAIKDANKTIEIWGEEQGARLLRIILGVYERKIKDCEQITNMRCAYTKLVEAEKVAAPAKKFSVIQGGLA